MKENTKSILTTTFKGLLQAIPYAGGALNEYFFEHRSRIKQERINKFTENLIELLERVKEKNVDLNYIQSIEFCDIFESILEKVSKVSDKEKVIKFNLITINQLKNPQKREYIETFLDLIPKVTEKQFEILWKHSLFDEKYFKIVDEIKELKNSLDINGKVEEKLNPYLDNLNKLKSERQRIMEQYQYPENYDLDLSEYQYLIQDLISKSLLLDVGIGAIGSKPLGLVKLTSFGIGFIEYVKE